MLGAWRDPRCASVTQEVCGGSSNLACGGRGGDWDVAMAGTGTAPHTTAADTDAAGAAVARAAAVACVPAAISTRRTAQLKQAVEV